MSADRIDVLAVMQIASDTCAAVARREGTAADLRQARAADVERRFQAGQRRAAALARVTQP